jgi:hypothetical protein
MLSKDKWAMAFHAVPTVGLLAQGLLYLTTTRFMPYHGEALGMTWEALPAHHQGFVLGVIKGMGAGSIGVTMALLIMLSGPFRRGDAWARWAVPAVGITFTLLTAYAAYTIDIRTPASPPWLQTLGLAAMYLAGAVVSFAPRKGPAPTKRA